MFGLYGNEEESSSEDAEQDSSADTSSTVSAFGQDAGAQAQPQTFGQSASDILKTLEMNSEQPKDLAPKPEPLSEDEKSARQLADAIADASDRSLNAGKVEQDLEQQMKHPFSSGLSTEYKGLADQLNSWEENNAAMYRYETGRL